mmetsp:Transcript_34043/g.60203  ORF Transcript_34043/g.60203 Transcript_34043/m.60203 type:complete len:119 (-) Transcript_34043:14-370(-)
MQFMNFSSSSQEHTPSKTHLHSFAIKARAVGSTPILVLLLVNAGALCALIAACCLLLRWTWTTALQLETYVKAINDKTLSVISDAGELRFGMSLEALDVLTSWLGLPSYSPGDTNHIS